MGKRFILGELRRAMARIRKVQYHEVIKPLRTAFTTSLGSKNYLRSVILKITLDDRRAVFGEIPTSFAVKDETIPLIKRTLGKISPGLVNKTIDNCRDKIAQWRGKYASMPMTISGLDVALFRAYLKDKNIPEHVWWNGKGSVLTTDITVPFSRDAGKLKTWLSYAVRNKFKAYKLKVSGDIDRDTRFISLIHNFLRAKTMDFTFRLDGNQAYNKDTCSRFLDVLAKKEWRVELFEQPLPKYDFKGLKAIKAKSFLPIILDETIFDCRDLEQAIAGDLCHGINIKLAKSGIQESIKMIKLAKKHKLKLMIGCMTETMVGLSAGIYLAAGSQAFDFIDLDAAYFLYQCHGDEGIRINANQYIIH